MRKSRIIQLTPIERVYASQESDKGYTALNCDFAAVHADGTCGLVVLCDKGTYEAVENIANFVGVCTCDGLKSFIKCHKDDIDLLNEDADDWKAEEEIIPFPINKHIQSIIDGEVDIPKEYDIAIGDVENLQKCSVDEFDLACNAFMFGFLRGQNAMEER